MKVRGFWTGDRGETAGQTRWSVPLVLVWMTMGVAAWASTVPPAVYYASAWNGGASPSPTIHGAGVVAVDTGLVSVAANPSATIDVSGFLDATHSFLAVAGRIEYYFEFSGPAGPIPVAIDVHLLDDFDDFAFRASGTFVLEGVDEACVGASIGCPNGEITRTLHETLSANSVYHVILSANAQGSSNNHGSAHVLVDPVIYLEPSFAGDPSQYTYDQSVGVGNSASAAPEPGTFAAGALILASIVVKRCRMAR